MKFIIYSIVNKINNKRYVGITSNYETRKRVHIWSLKNNKHGNLKLQRSVNKHGLINFSFEILETIETENRIEALEVEHKYILKYDSFKNGYNQTEGFDGSILQSYSDETKNKRSKVMIGNKHWPGRKHTEEEKKKIGMAHKGKIVSEKTREKMREIAKQRTGEKNAFYGKHHSKETVQKIVEKTGKKVVCINSGKIYDSLSACARDTGCDRRNIQRVCIGKSEQTKGYKFKFL